MGVRKMQKYEPTIKSVKPNLIVNDAKIRLSGWLEQRIEENLKQWIFPAPKANPGMLEMFRMRDRLPRLNIVPWYGEFSGKYITSAVLAYRMTENEQLRQMIDEMVSELAELQSDDGYLGPHPLEERLFGKTLEKQPLWDVWGHYHIMLGLYFWYEETLSEPAYDVLIKAADCICGTFLQAGHHILDANSTEVNTSIIHILCLLYGKTANPDYMSLILQIVESWKDEKGGDYIRDAVVGKAFYEFRKPRWESLHAIQGIAELYYLTGDEQLKTAFKQIWWSIAQYDRHNTGGFSTEEQAVGNPYAKGVIETCCTIAWMALTVDMLRLTGDSYVADELELTAWNGMLGSQHPSGRWWTYNTPVNGVRKASAHDIVFQSIQGSPELNCCSVNGPRGIGMFADWAILYSSNGLAVNYYGACTMQAKLPSGQNLVIKQQTEYPVEGDVLLSLELDTPERFELKLRIPIWSLNTSVYIGNEVIENVSSGAYLKLDRIWKHGDMIRIEFDMSLHYWVGEQEEEGNISIYRGPLLLTFDERFNETECEDIPVFKVEMLEYERIQQLQKWPEPLLLLRFRSQDGSLSVLCDFASAGMAGSRYASWLPMKGMQPFPFDKQNPIWNVRLL